RDVVYYVGHDGIKGDYGPIPLKAAYMFDIEMAQNEIHEPDLLIDVTETMGVKLRAALCRARAKVFGKQAGEKFAEEMKTWSRFWGMRHGVRYAEPLFGCAGSMDTTGSMKA